MALVPDKSRQGQDQEIIYTYWEPGVKYWGQDFYRE